MLESVVLRHMVSNISIASGALIATYSGDTYSTDRLSLSKMVQLIKDSHAKSNTVTMLDCFSSLMAVRMTSDDSFYLYADEVASLQKQLDSVFAEYKNEPTWKFFDLIVSLCMVSGLSKFNNIFESVLRSVRDMDLQKPSNKSIYPDILAKAVLANHTRDLLNEKPDFHGLSVTSNQSSNEAIVNSSVTTTTQTVQPCKNAGCSKLIAIVKDVNGVLLKNYCGPCFDIVKKNRNEKFRAALKSGKAIPADVLITHGQKTNTAPKSANSAAFSGSNAKLAHTATQSFMDSWKEADEEDSPY